jgi:hypothetical protein
VITDREPIVSAVLNDPVVQAVLLDPAAAPAVAEAISPGAASAIAPDAPPPPIAPVERRTAPTQAAVQRGQIGGAAPNKPDIVALPDGRLVAAPTSTEEEEKTSAGQRDTSMLWETTQRQIALSVISTALVVSAALAIFGKLLGSPELQLAAGVFLFGVANLVTGFYFGRTNHQRVGGVGPVLGR